MSPSCLVSFGSNFTMPQLCERDNVCRLPRQSAQAENTGSDPTPVLSRAARNVRLATGLQIGTRAALAWRESLRAASEGDKAMIAGLSPAPDTIGKGSARGPARAGIV